MNNEKWLLGGAVAAGLGAGLCCIVPLLSVGFGIGALSVLAATFAPARPYLLAAAVVMLAVGFYWIYFRCPQKTCANDAACATDKGERIARTGLWLTSILVLLFAVAPYLTASMLAGNGSDNNTAANVVAMQNSETKRARFKVAGMTCGGCEMTITKALENTPGVLKSEVSYERGEAIVDYDARQTTPEKIRAAINSTGYTAEIAN